MGASALRIRCFLTHSVLLDLCVPLTAAVGMSLGFLPVLRLDDGQIAEVRFIRQLRGGLEQFLTNLLRLPFCCSSLRRSKSVQLRVRIGLSGTNMHMISLMLHCDRAIIHGSQVVSCRGGCEHVPCQAGNLWRPVGLPNDLAQIARLRGILADRTWAEGAQHDGQTRQRFERTFRLTWS